MSKKYIHYFELFQLLFNLVTNQSYVFASNSFKHREQTREYLNPCYLTLSPDYSRTSRDFYYNEIKELNDVIFQINEKINELRFIRPSNKTLDILDNMEINEYEPLKDYNMVHFDINEKVLTRKLIKDPYMIKNDVYFKKFCDLYNGTDCFRLDFYPVNLSDFYSFVKNNYNEPNITLDYYLPLKPLNSPIFNSFKYNYESDSIFQLNELFRITYSNDSLVSIAIIYDLNLKQFYLRLQSQEHLTLKYKMSDTKRDIWIKNNEFLPFKNIFKHTQYVIVKYETFIPKNNCSQRITDSQSYIKEFDCEIETENRVINALNSRENIQEIYDLFISFLVSSGMQFESIELNRCVLFDYFGKIYTCGGKLISVEEYGTLKRRGIVITGLIIKTDMKKLVYQINKNCFIETNHEKVLQIENYKGGQPASFCNECNKIELRVKAEENRAYKKFKEAKRNTRESFEQNILLFLLLLSIVILFIKSKK